MDLSKVKNNNRRIALDAIRSVSIFSIVSYHVVQRWPHEVHSLVRLIAGYGQYGVDLFFALSGLLVGVSTASSFAARNNHGDLQRLCSRFVRIYIPYCVALIVAYAGVGFFRGENFNPVYLFLFQNFLLKIPFFLVSWFLCVLFAFYLLAYFLPRVKGISLSSSSFMLLLIAISCGVQRALLVAFGLVEHNLPFGFFFTATNLRADSIALAFAVGLVINRSTMLRRLRSISGLSAFVVLLILSIPLGLTKYLQFEGGVVDLAGVEHVYIFAPIFAAVPSTFLVAWAYLRRGAFGGLAKRLSKVSAIVFSLYLTHPFAIEAAIRISSGKNLSQPLLLALLIFLITLFALLFFIGVEQPSVRLAGFIKASK